METKDDTQPPARMGRLGSRKSANGCITCKIRKVKCDERHPACQRCTRTGRNCDGYVENQNTAIQLKFDPHSRTSTLQLAVSSNRDRVETQAFEFFIDQVIPGMTRIVDTDFWTKFVLQSAQADRVVWNATNAMSQLVRHLHQQNPSQDNENAEPSADSDRQLALRWYGRSIYELQARMKRQNAWSTVCSITAVLYMCIECLVNNQQGALRIYSQAMHTISNLVRKGPNENTVWKKDPINDSVLELFNHITVANGLPGTYNRHQSSEAKNISLREARDLLYQLIGECHQFVCFVTETRLYYQSKHWVPEAEMFRQRDLILDKLHKWKSAVSTVDDESDTEHSVVLSCMCLAHSIYTIWVSTVLDMFETAFDEHDSTFNEMLNYAEVVIRGYGTKQPLFSFESRVILSLSFLATRCRHPMMRRRAIKLLYQGPRIENTQNAVHTIAVAKRIVAIEESGGTGGEYLDYFDEPATLDHPREVDRIAWAKVAEKSEGCDDTGSYLRFGRWRLDANNEWFLTSETLKI